MAKNKRPRVITFELEQDRRCVVLAQLGLSNAYIAEETGLSENQVTGRLFKAKKAEGYEKGHTYRSEWRHGTSSAARTAINALGPQLSADAEKRLPKLFERPTARVSPTNRR